MNILNIPCEAHNNLSLFLEVLHYPEQVEEESWWELANKVSLGKMARGDGTGCSWWTVSTAGCKNEYIKYSQWA